MRHALTIALATWGLGFVVAASAADGPATQPASQDGTIIAEPSPEAADGATRPTASLVVQGGDENVVYRGWPILIDLQRTNAPADAVVPVLAIAGPTPIEAQPEPKLPGVWLISAEKSKSLAAGHYTLSAGTARAEIDVADEPAQLTPLQKVLKQRFTIAYAVKSGDSAAAEQLARDWVKAEAQNSEAHAALGDVLAANGKPKEALAAYNEAISRVGPNQPPPRQLLKRAADLRRALLPRMTTRAAPATSADENAFYKLIEEADAAMDAKKFADAVRAYDRARKLHADKKLTVNLRELDEKSAAAREAQSGSGKPPR